MSKAPSMPSPSSRRVKSCERKSMPLRAITNPTRKFIFSQVKKDCRGQKSAADMDAGASGGDSNTCWGGKLKTVKMSENMRGNLARAGTSPFTLPAAGLAVPPRPRSPRENCRLNTPPGSALLRFRATGGSARISIWPFEAGSAGRASSSQLRPADFSKMHIVIETGWTGDLVRE